jgi:hypothetical protein
MVLVRRALRIAATTVLAGALPLCLHAVVPAASADAAQEAPRHQFADPYQGGTRLGEGGAEPGAAYLALIDAVYKTDYARICTLLAAGADLDQCLKNPEMAKGFALMVGGSKSQRVLDGFRKGDEATLDVAYAWADAPDSYGFVVMQLLNGKWLPVRFGGSGSTNVDVKASGATQFGAPAAEKKP